MVLLTELPFDALNMIIVMLATSTNGARDIAHIFATCKLFIIIAERPHVLKAVNFQCLTLTNDFTMHHHPKDLLCVCAQAGNRAAKTILAKALLHNDTWFWQMIAYSNQYALDRKELYGGLLDYHTLVRSFIRHGSCTDIIKMRHQLLRYATSFVGYKAVRKFGFLTAVHNMCSHMFKTIQEHGVSSNLPDGRAEVVVIFDKLFPSKPV